MGKSRRMSGTKTVRVRFRSKMITFSGLMIWRMPVKDVLIYRGAGLVVPVAGEIKLMPGTSASPAYRRIDVDTETGHVHGLF